jgi:hypothetical protein
LSIGTHVHGHTYGPIREGLISGADHPALGFSEDLFFQKERRLWQTGVAGSYDRGVELLQTLAAN